MAIIRKGDKEAEKELKRAAVTQRRAREKVSVNEKEKAGRVMNTRGIKIDPKTKKAYRLGLGNPVTKNAYDIVRKPFSGPISGSSIGKASRQSTNVKKSVGSGVVKGGKVVKGGDIAEGVAKSQAKKKKGK